MKIITVMNLAVVMVLAVSCSSDKPTAPNSDTTLYFDIIGTDAPANMDAAMQELGDLSILVPDPVDPTDAVLRQDVNGEVLTAITLDDSVRVNFRRILAHLHDQMNALRRCMANNDDPRLLRLAHGAHQAIRRGILALENEEPRLALRYFHTANRMLNLANTLCRGRG